MLRVATGVFVFVFVYKQRFGNFKIHKQVKINNKIKEHFSVIMTPFSSSS